MYRRWAVCRDFYGAGEPLHAKEWSRSLGPEDIWFTCNKLTDADEPIIPLRRNRDILFRAPNAWLPRPLRVDDKPSLTAS